MKLWRPTGAAELKLIEASGWRRFPPRLPEQPIFYPVLSFAYAEQIAREWNSLRDEKVGFVVAFEVGDDIGGMYPPRLAGGSTHGELWVPAEELNAFNDAIVGAIRLIATYRDGARVEN